MVSFFDKKLQFTYVQAQLKPLALKREHRALQKMKFLNLCLWVIFALLDPGPDTDLDPQH
jgi:hypothetical protein